MSQCCFNLTARKLFSAIVLLSMILSLSPGLMMNAQAQTPDPANPTVVVQPTQAVENNPTETAFQPTDVPPTVQVTPTITQVPPTAVAPLPTQIPPIQTPAVATAIPPANPTPQSGANGWRVSTDPQSGNVRFMGSDSANPLFSSASLGQVSAQSTDVAAAFLQAFGARFGIADPGKELSVMRTNSDLVGNQSVRYQQMYQGVPVLGREMIVQADSKLDVISASGKISGGLSLDVKPGVDPAIAQQTAISAVAAEFPDEDPAQLAASNASLWVYDSDALGFHFARIQALVWEFTVSSKDSHPISEVVLVDAHSGLILQHKTPCWLVSVFWPHVIDFKALLAVRTHPYPLIKLSFRKIQG